MIADPSFYYAAVPAVIFMGLSKGGFSGLALLGLPLMALFISPIQAAAITLPILIVQDAVSVWAFRHHWDRRNLAILLPGAIVGILLGYLLAAWVQDAAVRLTVGIIAVTFAARRLVLERRPEAVTPTDADVPRGLLWGTVSGFASMIAHAGGAPFQVYVMPQRLARDVFVGTGAIFFGLINWIKVPPYIALGQFTAENLATSLVLFPLAIAATWAGVWLVRRLSMERFYTIAYLLLLGVGLKLIYDGVVALI
jgi:uncharacterized membrane protein YfcA